jgi:hypothetical protein
VPCSVQLLVPTSGSVPVTGHEYFVDNKTMDAETICLCAYWASPFVVQDVIFLSTSSKTSCLEQPAEESAPARELSNHIELPPNGWEAVEPFIRAVKAK